MKEKTKKGQPSFIFSKYGPIPAYFSFIFILSIIQIEKSVAGVFGIRTQGRIMVGTD